MTESTTLLNESDIRSILAPLSFQGSSLSSLLLHADITDGKLFLVFQLSEPSEAWDQMALEISRQFATLAPNLQVFSIGTPPEDMLPSPGIRNVKKIIAVGAGKGGVGKSTVAVQLALAFHHQGLQTGILDGDIYGPSLGLLLGLSGKPTSPDGKTLLPLEAHGLKAMSLSQLAPPNTAAVWRGPMIQNALTQMLEQVRWGNLDVLIVDLPPGTGDIPLTLAQRVPLTGIILVSTPQDVAVQDMLKAANMFQRLKVPLLGIIENMATFTCTTCGTPHPFFGSGGAEKAAQKLEIPFLGALPYLPEIRAQEEAPPASLEPQPFFRGLAERLSSAL